ncbi:hypothetical protein F25303_12997 [Fusarium sp. NRRL 25303]|nr:hypothetical protein F25303_12997 [Fusarium sp. NRRL 25303]
MLQTEEKSARTEEDVASKGDASPDIPKSSSRVTKSITEDPIKRGGEKLPNDAARRPVAIFPQAQPFGTLRVFRCERELGFCTAHCVARKFQR